MSNNKIIEFNPLTNEQLKQIKKDTFQQNPSSFFAQSIKTENNNLTKEEVRQIFREEFERIGVLNEYRNLINKGVKK